MARRSTKVEVATITRRDRGQVVLARKRPVRPPTSVGMLEHQWKACPYVPYGSYLKFESVKHSKSNLHVFESRIWEFWPANLRDCNHLVTRIRSRSAMTVHYHSSTDGSAGPKLQHIWIPLCNQNPRSIETKRNAFAPVLLPRPPVADRQSD